MVSLNPMERATVLGGSVAAVPLRLVGGLAAPARGDMARNVRRAMGIRDERPAPIAFDPDEAYLPPDGVARRVHADLPTMLIGGVSALLLQSLHPLAMAGVAEHSSYQEDPLGRLRRTASFVGTTTFGTVAEAEAAIAQVHRVHRRVKGIAPDGRPYAADDPELVTFIHVAEVASFLTSSQRYGSRPLTPEECDEYYEQVAPVALALGATWAPRSAAEVESYLLRIRPISTPDRKRGRPGTGCCAGWPGGRARKPSTPSSSLPPSACCPAGPAGSSGSPSPAPSTWSSTPPPSPRWHAGWPPPCAGSSRRPGRRFRWRARARRRSPRPGP